jgi:membrane-associated phospholipid phosphatase
VVLALFTFPCAAQHITAHSTLEVAQVTETIIPAHGLHGGAAVWGSTGHYFGQLVAEQVFKVGSVHISVQQLIIAYFALGQGFPSQHAAAYTSHVFAIPVLL